MNLWRTYESQATQLRTLDLMLLSTHLPTVQPTFRIFLSFHWQKLSQREMWSVWSVIAILGILPVAVFYFMRSA